MTGSNATPTLTCTDLRMRYGSSEPWALGDDDRGVTFDVAEGELFALLGPSGCGKTTTLRIVGGFLRPTAGVVSINGRDVTDAPPYDRPTNTVFQSYALFPHKSVADNVAFGLKVKRVPRSERQQRVRHALQMVGLEDYAKRRVGELSGGQAQRAALARALVNRPAVLLLDEPLGALDLKLRRQMQDELARVKQETNTSFVHVTHDQEEACAIADRIGVMDAGHIVQIAAPYDLYRSPRNTYVAEFINVGTVVRGVTRRDGGVVEVANGALTIRGVASPELNGAVDFAAVLPPHRIEVTAPDAPAKEPGAGEVRGSIERITFTGSLFECSVRVSNELVLRAALTLQQTAALGGVPAPGAPVMARWSPDDVIFVEDTKVVSGNREADG